MRQGQQNRRGRGRNNHNNNHQHRKGGQNPLTRSFESTGPDTKIRGTPAHIAEKYMVLARDALSSGDPVLAENYLQHAEHYNRIIMAYREQAQQNGEYANGAQPPQPSRFQSVDGDEFGEDGDEFGSEQPVVAQPGEPQPQPQQPPQQPRNFEGQGQRDDRGQQGGYEGGHRSQHRHQGNRDRFGGEPRNFQDRSDRPDRNDRGERRERFDRGDRGDRPDRSDQNRGEQRFERQPPQEGQGDPRRREPRERFAPAQPQHEQPEFLRRPVRRPRREGEESEGAAVVAPQTDDTSRD